MDTLWTAVSLVLSAVTVHPNNAMFVHTGSLSLKRGYNAFVWADLPLHTSNLRVILPPTTRAYVVESRIEPYTPTQTEEPEDLRFWRRRIDSLEKLVYTYESRLSLLKAQEATLLENKKLGGAEGGTSAPAVEAYVRLLERELPRIREAMYPLSRSIEAAKDSLSRWKTAYESRKQHYTQRRSALYLRLWSPQNEFIPLRVEVQVPNARWGTAYFLRLPNVTEGLLYVQRWAGIQNKTGIDWKNVQLTLSTALPSQAAEAPPFQPWYVDLYGEIRAFTRAPEAAKALGAMEDARNSPEGGAEPDEGAEKENHLLPVESNVLLARTYTLGTHTIPTGENTVQLLLKEDTFSVQPFFLVNGPATPKAYMRAALPLSVMRLSDEGEARIEVEGQPVGRLRWPPRTKEDTVWLDLGPTERLVVSREEIERRRETTLAGGMVRYLFTYRLSVASTYERPVRVVVWDRIPVSRHSDIKVDLTDGGKGTLDAETGRLSWTITLEPGQRWETTFRFTVRAPKGKAILGL
jgi:uncharacterized protein (TIGR02231 family)